MGRYSLDCACSFKTLVESLGWIFVEIFGIYGVLVRQNLEFYEISDSHYGPNGPNFKIVDPQGFNKLEGFIDSLT